MTLQDELDNARLTVLRLDVEIEEMVLDGDFDDGDLAVLEAEYASAQAEVSRLEGIISRNFQE